MLYAIYRKNNKVAVLDTDDGVVEYISEDELSSLRSIGFHITDKEVLNFCTSYCSYITKYKVVNGIFDAKFRLDLCQKLNLLSKYLGYPLLNDLANFDVDVIPFEKYYYVILKGYKDHDLLYTISEDGIFLFTPDFTNNYKIYIQREDVVHVVDNTLYMVYSDFKIDNRCNIIKRKDIRPALLEQVGEEIDD
jgi:hypothetical protein